ncbi:MAG TPA: radical SAM protein [Deltaproteobacteria bacterium]|nr:radical SAM protein [Deltaproteobacteria bacterium]
MGDNPPFLISWNITRRCNLRCGHCYLDADELGGADPVDTVRALGFVDEIADLTPGGAMLILTGGEPLLREDLPEISSHAAARGLVVVVGTNGTLLDDRSVAMLRDGGVAGVGISVDSASPAVHDRLRGVEGSWRATLEGVEALRRGGLDFQLQFTVTRESSREIGDVIALGAELGARAVNIFFLVCTGRGQRMTDLSSDEYEEVLHAIVEAEREYAGRIMVRARCAPHVLRVARRANPGSALLRGETSGCIAGTGYLRISPEGYVTPCPYIPYGPASPQLGKESLRAIWERDPMMRSLREPRYTGTCGDCEFNDVCGGCRARALASGGDLMGEDDWCGYEPEGPPARGGGGGSVADSKAAGPVWTAEARERLGRVPSFLRPMVRRGLERYARAMGIAEITPELMAELRRRQKDGR